MKLPKVLEIGPYSYDLLISGELIRDFEHNRGTNGYTYGYSDHVNTQIVLNPANSPCQMRETLWHEIKHCVFPHILAGDPLDEETVVGLTSPGEMDALRRNKGLVEFLIER